jgi:beta-lactamase regulating signal transducer with metallopeptidase domain
MIAWAIEALIASALLMVLVLAIRTPVRAAFGPQVAYALWAIPALRMILPPDIMPRFWPEAANPIADASEVIYIFDTGSAPVAATSATPILGEIVAWLWLAGGLAFVAWQAIAFLNLRQRLLCGAHERTRIGGVRVMEARSGEGPLAFGIFDRCVILPADFDASYDSEEQRLALAHELAHHQRGDLIANTIALAVLALHWFNPLAWFAFSAFRADQEMACDARVIAADPAIRHAYGLAIVKSARAGTITAACHLHTIEQLKGRLRMLNGKAKSRSRVALGALAATLLTGVALAATASGSKAGAAIEQASERVVTALAVPPVPPVPPVPAAPEAPLAPQAVAAPPAPPAPLTPPEWADDNDGGPHKIVKRKVRVIRDGKEVAWNEDDMPNIEGRDCGDGEGDGKTHVIKRKDGKKQITIICTNRIERDAEAAALASVDAEKISRDAMRSAMAGLAAARASIASAEMSAEDRAEAMAGIAEAQRELETELRKGE